MKLTKPLPLIAPLGLALLLSCQPPGVGVGEGDGPSNPQATPETRALLANLHRVAPNSLLFGHQDALAYGIGWWDADFRSDVHDVGADHPAVFGWDIGRIGGEVNIDSVPFARIARWIREVYRRGGINTISWHTCNPITGQGPWDTTHRPVPRILPGGSHHQEFKGMLDAVAQFLGGLRADDGTPIPIIFRPFHEHTGDWFWWGEAHCTREEYIALWRFTFNYLVHERQLHHLLWAYSPDRFGDKARYMDRFPGEGYVDILGFDNYGDMSELARVPEAIRQLGLVVELADSLGKIAALTETGHNRIPYPNWWTDFLLNPIMSDSLARRIAWVLVWRNASPDHRFAPSPGHPSVPNFMEFYNHPFTTFLGDLPSMYQAGPAR